MRNDTIHEIMEIYRETANRNDDMSRTLEANHYREKADEKKIENLRRELIQAQAGAQEALAELEKARNTGQKLREHRDRLADTVERARRSLTKYNNNEIDEEELLAQLTNALIDKREGKA